MAIFDLVMPKMGESIVEATILRWNKKVGDTVKVDETILDVATDKVDSEVPSSVNGVLKEILYGVNDVIKIGTVIAKIETTVQDAISKSTALDPKPTNLGIPIPENFLINKEANFGHQVPFAPQANNAGNAPKANNNRFFSPLVLNIANSEGLALSELEQVVGTGADGRVTKKDVLQYIADKKSGRIPPYSQPVQTVFISQPSPVPYTSPAPYLQHSPLFPTVPLQSSNQPLSVIEPNISNGEIKKEETQSIVSFPIEEKAKSEIISPIVNPDLKKEETKKSFSEPLLPVEQATVAPVIKNTPIEISTSPYLPKVEIETQPVYHLPPTNIPIATHDAIHTIKAKEETIVEQIIQDPQKSEKERPLGENIQPLNQPNIPTQLVETPKQPDFLKEFRKQKHQPLAQPFAQSSPENSFVEPKVSLGTDTFFIEAAKESNKLEPKVEELPSFAQKKQVIEATQIAQNITQTERIVDKIEFPKEIIQPDTSIPKAKPIEHDDTKNKPNDEEYENIPHLVALPKITTPLPRLADPSGKFSTQAQAHPSGNTEIIEMDRMRRAIAKHMVESIHISPHVTVFAEADVTNMVLWRERVKAEFERRENTKITFTPMFVEGIVNIIKKYPLLNSSLEGEKIIIKKDYNIGMATALPTGNLIVPVIKAADKLNIVGLAAAVNNLANNARNGKLKPDDTTGGTFTFTNIGSFGSLMGTPIINQPQVAIISVGVIKKRAVVIEGPTGDTIGIRHMMYLSLSFDHRVVDGGIGSSFLTDVAKEFERWDVNRQWYSYL